LLLYNKKMTSNNSSQYINLNDNHSLINNLRFENLVYIIISNPPNSVSRRNLRNTINSYEKNDNEINFIDIFSLDNYEANFR